MITLKEFRKYRYCGKGYFVYESTNKMTPQLYLDYAIEDVIHKSERSLINALSNCKRSLHFQIDIIVDILGYNSKKSNFNSFPSKLEFCKKSGVVTPRILQKINRIRNLMEHEYFVPESEKVDDFIDVVELFLAATNKYIYELPNDLEFEVYDTDKYGDIEIGFASAKFKPFEGCINIFAHRVTCESNKLSRAISAEKNKIKQSRAKKPLSKNEIDVLSIKRAVDKNIVEDNIIIKVNEDQFEEWLSTYLKHAYSMRTT